MLIFFFLFARWAKGGERPVNISGQKEVSIDIKCRTSHDRVRNGDIEKRAASESASMV